MNKIIALLFTILCSCSSNSNKLDCTIEESSWSCQQNEYSWKCSIDGDFLNCEDNNGYSGRSIIKAKIKKKLTYFPWPAPDPTPTPTDDGGNCTPCLYGCINNECLPPPAEDWK